MMAADALYRLLAWLSPGFPVGAFSYSHGLEAVVESGWISDRTSLQRWVRAAIVHGGGRIDADILRDAHWAAAAGDVAAFAEANRRGVAHRATAELALETLSQGEAFLAAYCAAWPEVLLPHPNPPPHAGEGWAGAASEDAVCYPAAIGAATARAGIALPDALVGYLQAMAANLVSAGLRLGVVGQTDGQRILAALEEDVIAAANDAIARAPEDFGAMTFALDLASMAHETQYSRLFRS
jgi:urease accessory protein